MPFYRKQILAEILTKKLRTFRDPAFIIPTLDIVTPAFIQAVPIISTVVVDDIPLFNQDTFTTGVVSNDGGNRSTASADMSITYSGNDDAPFTTNAATFIVNTDAPTFMDQLASNGSTASAIGVQSSAGNKGTFNTGVVSNVVVSNVGGHRSTASADMSVTYSGNSGNDDASFTTDTATFIDQPENNGSTASTIGVDLIPTRVNVLDRLTREEGENWSSPFFFQNEDGDPHIELAIGFRFPSTIKPDTQGGRTLNSRQTASSLIEKIDRSTRIHSHFECCVQKSQDGKNFMSIGCKKSRCYYKNHLAANAISKHTLVPGDSDTSGEGNVYPHFFHPFNCFWYMFWSHVCAIAK